MKKIKKAIKSLMFDFYCFRLKLSRKIGLHRIDSQAVLILPPADAGSLGDQAMMEATISHLKVEGVEEITSIAYKSAEDCSSFYGGIESVACTERYEFAKLASKYTDFFCLGADVMDGHYSEGGSLLRLRLTSIASKVGLNASILGFSFNENPKASIVKALSSLSHEIGLYARDPISRDRLARVLNRPVDLVADLAFLLKPDNSSERMSSAVEWIINEKNKDRSVIGINANHVLLNDAKGKDIHDLCKIYIDVVTKFSEDNDYSFVLIPHDFRSKNDVGDIQFAELILDGLPHHIKKHSMTIPVPCTASEIKFMCGKLDLVLTGRMHLAIAALGQCTPTACITYQGKFEGLFKHFEIDDMAITPEEALQPSKFLQFLNAAMSKRSEVRDQISKKLPEVHKKSMLNFSNYS